MAKKSQSVMTTDDSVASSPDQPATAAVATRKGTAKQKVEWDDRDTRLLIRLYNEQPVACDALVYTPEMDTIENDFNKKAVAKRNVRDLYLRLQLLRKRGNLPKKQRGIA